VPLDVRGRTRHPRGRARQHRRGSGVLQVGPPDYAVRPIHAALVVGRVAATVERHAGRDESGGSAADVGRRVTTTGHIRPPAALDETRRHRLVAGRWPEGGRVVGADADGPALRRELVADARPGHLDQDVQSCGNRTRGSLSSGGANPRSITATTAGPTGADDLKAFPGVAY